LGSAKTFPIFRVDLNALRSRWQRRHLPSGHDRVIKRTWNIFKRHVVGGKALVSAEAVERAGEFDDFDIAFCIAWSDGRGDRCVRIH
jgi:hypothetical protein